MRQTLSKAQRIHRAALGSEAQAETYEAMIQHLNTIPVTALALSEEVIRDEVKRLRRTADEMWSDYDEKVGEIDPRWIDSL